jgi:hypothetical protein
MTSKDCVMVECLDNCEENCEWFIRDAVVNVQFEEYVEELRRVLSYVPCDQHG